MFTVRRTAAAALLGAALVLSACDGAGDPEVTENTPVSDGGGVLDDRPGAGDEDADAGASDSGGGDVVAADVPAPDPADFPGMDENTPEGAEQAFKYYIAVLMWSYQAGDSRLLRTLEHPECSVCDHNAEELTEFLEGGGRWSDVAIEEVRLSSSSHDEFDFEVRYDFAVSPHTEYADAESGGESIPRTEYVAAAGLIWAEEKWLIGDVAARWSKDEHA